MVRTVNDISREINDRFLSDAVLRVFDGIMFTGDNGLYESQLSERLAENNCLGNNIIHHTAYLRTALDILEDEGLIQKKKGRYFVR